MNAAMTGNAAITGHAEMTGTAEITGESSTSQHRSLNQKTAHTSSAEWQPNIGKLDRYIRLASGLFLIGSSVSSRNSSLGSRALMALGAMKVTEGILGWCPVMELFGIKDTRGVVESQNENNISNRNNQTTKSNTNREMKHSKIDDSHHGPADEISAQHHGQQHEHRQVNGSLASIHHQGSDQTKENSGRHLSSQRPLDGTTRSQPNEGDYQQKEPSGHQGPQLESWNRMADSRNKSERDEVVAAMNTSFQ
ncbi:YgaP family membrane protein [Alicyclobacillus ferrooxydans]|uniref:YgaP family membrane protein n=1 Tax=Alicyclobacillus ferrooxydans TaxID=471514 RepID=UPI0006D575FB|nr:DUF2892 domain-containing protein [Alicyclobacillus ferrooxydans]